MTLSPSAQRRRSCERPYLVLRVCSFFNTLRVEWERELLHWQLAAPHCFRRQNKKHENERNTCSAATVPPLPLLIGRCPPQCCLSTPVTHPFSLGAQRPHCTAATRSEELAVRRLAPASSGPAALSAPT